MDREYEYLLHLMGAYLWEEAPEIDRDVSWEKLQRLAQIHNLTGVLNYVAMTYPICPDPQKRAMHRRLCMSTIVGFSTRGALAEEFSQTLSDHGIDHIMMKGFVLKEFFPVPELRTYGDIDLVIRKEDRAKCHKLMKAQGFAVEVDWEPVYGYRRDTEFYELHTELLETDISVKANCRDYFRDPWAHAHRVEGSRFEFEPAYHFLYLLTHLAKHVEDSGAGIRMYLDIAVFVKYYEKTLNWDSVEEELHILSLWDFANMVLHVTEKYFGIRSPFAGRPVDPEVMEAFLELTMEGGIFGLIGMDAGITSLKKESRVRGGFSRLGTIKNRLFPAAETIETRYTYLQKKPWLLPVAWIHRLAISGSSFREHTEEVRGILSADQKKVEKLNRICKEIGL